MGNKQGASSDAKEDGGGLLRLQTGAHTNLLPELCTIVAQYAVTHCWATVGPYASPFMHVCGDKIMRRPDGPETYLGGLAAGSLQTHGLRWTFIGLPGKAIYYGIARRSGIPKWSRPQYPIISLTPWHTTDMTDQNFIAVRIFPGDCAVAIYDRGQTTRSNSEIIPPNQSPESTVSFDVTSGIPHLSVNGSNWLKLTEKPIEDPNDWTPYVALSFDSEFKLSVRLTNI